MKLRSAPTGSDKCLLRARCRCEGYWRGRLRLRVSGAAGRSPIGGRLHRVAVECFRVSIFIPYTCRCAVRWLSGRKPRFAKAARTLRTGLKFTISGPFFIGLLVGVGCRMMVVGPRLGTLLGTLRPTPTCAF
jgi:hypothetical protein